MSSDYISKSALIDLFKDLADEHETNAISYNALCEVILQQKTISETEIIRKPFERVVERFINEKERHDKDCSYWSEYSWKDEIQFNECDMSRKKSECFEEAIEIVKEECGISE